MTATTAGYSGGTVENPTYKEVCSGRTGHAEVVQVEYDPARVSYEELLNLFWSIHDPTQLNRPGNDVSGQYRSAIFFHTPQQEATARNSKQDLEASGRLAKPIVTEITRACTLYKAEEYHQHYLGKRRRTGCASTLRP